MKPQHTSKTRPVVAVKSERVYSTPLFLPVFQYENPFVSIEMLQNEFRVAGLITNAFFLYKRREIKETVLEQGIKDFLGFNGLIVTDSGAFQQFSGPLYLSNKKIIRFQRDIGVDVISPLDVITTPGDNRTTATKKLDTTLKRIKEGLDLVTEQAILIGVQQGGRFLELRRQALEQLMELDVEYIALGSLVPFFTKNHKVEFIGKVIQQAREIVPSHIPIHLYGAGDPLELPFYIALGCDIFDSSSFIHYARGGWYMTPYGALDVQQMRSEDISYVCKCPYCCRFGKMLWEDEKKLALHNLWMILQVLQEVKQHLQNNTLSDYLLDVLERHQEWFPQSQLARSWEGLHSS